MILLRQRFDFHTVKQTFGPLGYFSREGAIQIHSPNHCRVEKISAACTIYANNMEEKTASLVIQFVDEYVVFNVDNKI